MTKFFFKTTASSAAVRKLAQAVVGVISQTISDEETLYTFDLALFEACANVVQHAYKDQEPGDLLIVLGVEPGEYLDVEIIDWGKGFPSYPVHIRNAHPEAERGRGLFIISQLCSRFEIRREETKTILHMTMQITRNKWKQYE